MKHVFVNLHEHLNQLPVLYILIVVLKAEHERVMYKIRPVIIVFLKGDYLVMKK